MIIVKNDREFKALMPDFFLSYDSIKCKCCGEFLFSVHSETFLKVLDQFKKEKMPGQKLLLTNLYRCQKHNQEVGGVKGSAHVEALAADIYCNQLKIVELFKKAAEIKAFSGIGIYKKSGFVHVDIKPRKNRIFWVVINKKYEYFSKLDEALAYYEKGVEE